MTPDEILALYEWTLGNCFRCALTDLYVTRIKQIATPAGHTYPLDACGSCVLILEGERQRFALRQGRQYTPGALAS